MVSQSYQRGRDSVRYLEDFQPGRTLDFGDCLITEEAIISFGRAFDPQPFHIDRNPAPGSGHVSLIASGWHTCAITMRMMVDHFFHPDTSLPSPGIDELRWHRPVQAGDRLRVRITILEARVSSSKPDRGFVRMKVETFNQRDLPVLSYIGLNFFKRRQHEAAG